MKYSKVLVLSLIIGMYTQVSDVVAMDGLLEIVGETEQQKVYEQSSVSIPVQGYIFSNSEELLEQVKPSLVQPGEMSVGSITKTGDPLEYPLYGSIIALSLLWIVMLWKMREDNKQVQ